MRYLNLIVVMVLACQCVHAATVTITWDHPTQYVDGTPLPSGALTATRIEWGTCNGTSFGTRAGERIVPYPAATTTIDLAPGTHCIRAYSRTASAESSPTNTLVHTVLPPAPQPPSNLRVSAQTVYTSVKRTDRLVMLPVGTVPAETGCIPTEGVIAGGVTYYAVPRAAVRWSGSVRPDAVYAICS